MQNIARRIKTLRETYNYTQAFMAAELAVSQATYCRIEQGNYSLSIQRLQAIADILNVPLASFFVQNYEYNIHRVEEMERVIKMNESLIQQNLLLTQEVKRLS
ncbi:MAG: helix-turn-helix domain-containing protein [Thermonemataceae bacterium]